MSNIKTGKNNNFRKDKDKLAQSLRTNLLRRKAKTKIRKKNEEPKKSNFS
jgi:hypothetical protein